MKFITDFYRKCTFIEILDVMTSQEIKDIIPVDKVYEDALRPAMKQIGLALESVTKTSRFLLAPIEFLAAQHDRWQHYLTKVAERVDDANLIEGSPQIVIPTLERLILVNEDSLLAELFINLLAASIDKTKQDLAHPSFPNILSQLSHDEAVMLYFHKRGVRICRRQGHYIMRQSSPDEPYILIEDILSFPNHTQSYNEHLIGLSLLDFGLGGIPLTKFGQLFVDACVPSIYRDLDSCRIWYGRNVTDEDIRSANDS